MLRFLIEKEFKQIGRNHFLPKIIVVFPFMMLLILPMAADFEIKNINLAVVDNDHSRFSARLVNKVVSTGYFRLSTTAPTYREALTSVELDRADIILEIPAGFEKMLVNNQPVSVLVSANTVNGTRGGLGSAFLSGIVSDYSEEIFMQVHAAGGLPRPVTPQLRVVPQFRFNPTMQYQIFMVPALMVMMLALICGFLPALNIIGEKERGTMEQINVSPVKRSVFILSKLIPHWIMGFIVLTVCFGVAWLIYGLIPKGNLLTIYLFASIFVLAFSGFGLFISNIAKTMQQAMFIMFFFVITFILMSGLYTPVASMPQWAQYISTISPLKYFIMVMRLVYLKGSGFGDLIRPFIALCCFAVGFNIVAVLTYRKST